MGLNTPPGLDFSRRKTCIEMSYNSLKQRGRVTGPVPQIYVEIERARLTRTLANIKEQSGDVKEAASILQELQVREGEERALGVKVIIGDGLAHRVPRPLCL